MATGKRVGCIAHNLVVVGCVSLCEVAWGTGKCTARRYTFLLVPPGCFCCSGRIDDRSKKEKSSDSSPTAPKAPQKKYRKRRPGPRKLLGEQMDSADAVAAPAAAAEPRRKRRTIREGIARGRPPADTHFIVRLSERCGGGGCPGGGAPGAEEAPGRLAVQPKLPVTLGSGAPGRMRQGPQTIPAAGFFQVGRKNGRFQLCALYRVFSARTPIFHGSRFWERRTVADANTLHLGTYTVACAGWIFCDVQRLRTRAMVSATSFASSSPLSHSSKSAKLRSCRNMSSQICSST
eukprot:gene23692-biopygen20839